MPGVKDQMANDRELSRLQVPQPRRVAPAPNVQTEGSSPPHGTKPSWRPSQRPFGLV